MQERRESRYVYAAEGHLAGVYTYVHSNGKYADEDEPVWSSKHINHNRMYGQFYIYIHSNTEKQKLIIKETDC